jgi:hypothetical protein
MDKQIGWEMNSGGGKEIIECNNKNEGIVSTWRGRNGGREEWRKNGKIKGMETQYGRRK